MSLTPRTRIQSIIPLVSAIGHCCEISREIPVYLPLCLCRQLEQTKLLSERVRGRALASPSPSLPPSPQYNLPRPATASLVQLDKCILLQLQAHHSGKKHTT